MRPTFNMQYAEFAVADYLKRNIKRSSVFVPLDENQKGIDLLLYSSDKNNIIGVQVKSGRPYGETKKDKSIFNYWFNKYKPHNNADWHIVCCYYPDMYNIFKKRKKQWMCIMFAFTRKEINKLVSKKDNFFAISIDVNGNAICIRGNKSKINTSLNEYMIKNRKTEIKESLYKKFKKSIKQN